MTSTTLPGTSTLPEPTSSSGSGSDGLDETGPPKLDVAGGTMGDDGIETGDESCKKVDLLFVIDDSGSMADEQANLAASVPGFIEAMRAELAETDGYNIGVVTSDLYIFDVSCGPVSIGNLVTQTGGVDSSNNVCSPYSSGMRFMTENDNLDNKFACAAQVGTSGDGDEHPMEAMLTALSPELTDPGMCNEGFLRDDALLVVVIITDEEDDHETEEQACNMTVQPGSPGEPGDWFDDLVAVKDKESHIVVLSLVGPDAEAGSMCPALDKCNGGIEGAEVATRILEFTRMFTYGFIGPVCEDYGPIFQEAIGVIKTACDEFGPVG
ncbi:hypothetical protein [Paraliomyxa miuraensis]|uniref:hypothetical protein n=1 Tax=Paraliomyxa miuraensis TaxID=376150 RepID=UPI00225219DC|nr:hypothetical protein [Paraliomyxa miuraensis]MCX4241234.1 hypothetical protein [Paraliomyxa miuraensis]